MSSEAREEEDPVPQAICDAERWRLLGREIRERDPELFERIFARIVFTYTREHYEDSRSTTESYFLT